MTDNELALEGFQLCEMAGDCDFCHQDIPQGEYFWRRTSYEYVEGDYSCRACAVAQLVKEQALYDSYEQNMRYCPECSTPMDWIECDSCGGEGFFDSERLMEEDPLWYDEDSTEDCSDCNGDGGWWHCFHCVVVA